MSLGLDWPYQGLDEVSSVLKQCDGYWIPNRAVLVEKYKLINSAPDSCHDGAPQEGIQLTPEALEKKALFEDTISHIENIDSWDVWIEKTLGLDWPYQGLEPYKHTTDYGIRPW